MEINRTLHELADDRHEGQLRSLRDAGLEPAQWQLAVNKRTRSSNN